MKRVAVWADKGHCNGPVNVLRRRKELGFLEIGDAAESEEDDQGGETDIASRMPNVTIIQ